MGSLSNDEMAFAPQYQRPSKNTDSSIRLLPQALDKLAADAPDHVIGIIANPGTMPNLSFTSLSSAQMANAVNFTAHWLHSLLDKDPYETICYIGLQDFRYWIMTLAAIKTGHPLLLASARNAITNNISLLDTANCNVIFYSGAGTPYETHVKNLESAVSGLRTYEVPSLETMTTIKFGHYPYNKTFEEAKKDVALFLHTSGSTGNPKPIRITNTYLCRIDIVHLLPVPDGKILAGVRLARKKRLAYLGAPLFHMSGVISMCVSLFLESTTVLGPVDHLPSGEVAGAIIRNIRLNALAAVPFILDDVFGTKGEELKEHFADLDYVASFGGELLLVRADDYVRI